MDIRSLDFSDSSFNAIFCLATLIHVDDDTTINKNRSSLTKITNKF